MREFKFHFLIIFVVWSIWLLFLGFSQALEIVLNNLAVVLTMLLGSFVAGSTSVGGGAVAFPVFTKVLQVDSETALIFSLAIQSVGMMSATILIFISRIPVNLRIIWLSILPGAAGIFAGLFYFRLLIASPDIKYLFSCFSFFVAVSLITYHIQEKSKSTNEADPALSSIVIACFLGGILSGIIGTGIDFIIFILMLFAWRFDFKVATATSVVVMAFNALAGFMMTLSNSSLFSGEVVYYWLAAVPIVAVGAPLGALACKYLHKNIIFYFLLCLILIDVASTIIILGIKLEFILPLLSVFSILFIYRKARFKV